MEVLVTGSQMRVIHLIFYSVIDLLYSHSYYLFSLEKKFCSLGGIEALSPTASSSS